MKKFLVVLTILVLVAGFAFAAVTGYVEAKYKFDFTDAKELTYGISGKHSKVSFTISTEQAKVDGKNKPYATVTVDVELGVEFDENEQTLLYADSYVWPGETVVNFDWGVKLSDFRIVGENWEIDFLKAIGVGDYAKSAWEIDGADDEDDRKALDAPWAFGKSKGFTVTYDDYKVGVKADRVKVAGVYTLDVKVRAESKELAFAEGVTGQAAVGIGLGKKGDADMTFDFGVSVKAAYATDALTVKGAVDLQNVSEKFNLDASVNVAVKPVTVDAYYATSLKVERLHSVLEDKAENVLSIRAIIDLDPVKVTVVGEDLINNDRLFGVKEEGKFGALSEDAQFGILPSLGKEADDDVKVGIWFANAGVGYDVQENLNVNAHVGFERAYAKVDDEKSYYNGFAVQVGAVYTLDVVKITADAYIGKESADKDTAEEMDLDEDVHFAFVLGASSDTLVENAVLSAKLNIDKYGVVGLYKTTRAVDEFNPASLFDYGTGNMSLTLSCKVAF